MNVDDFVKITLALSVAFSLVGISFQIMRLIGKLADSLQDLRKAIQNISNMSDMVLEDYMEVRTILRAVIDLVKNFRSQVIEPLSKLGGAVSALAGLMKFKGKEEESDTRAE